MVNPQMAVAPRNPRAGGRFGTPLGLALLIAITAALAGTGTWSKMKAEMKWVVEELTTAHSWISQANKSLILSEWQTCTDNPALHESNACKGLLTLSLDDITSQLAAARRMHDIHAPPTPHSNGTAQAFEVRMALYASSLLRSWTDTRCDDWTVSLEDLPVSEGFVPLSEFRLPRIGFCLCLEIVATPIRVLFFVSRVVLQALLVLFFVVAKVLSVYFTWLMYFWAGAVEGIWYAFVNFGALVSFPVFLFWYVVTQWKLLLLIAVGVVFVVYTPSPEL